MACVRAVKPEAVSIAVKELIPDAASEAAARAFLSELEEQRCFGFSLFAIQLMMLNGFSTCRRVASIPQATPFFAVCAGALHKGPAIRP